jgi:hypothetical protein
MAGDRKVVFIEFGYGCRGSKTGSILNSSASEAMAILVH